MRLSMRAVQALAVVLLMSGVAVADDAAGKAVKQQSDSAAPAAAEDSGSDASATTAADGETKAAGQARTRQVRHAPSGGRSGSLQSWGRAIPRRFTASSTVAP